MGHLPSHSRRQRSMSSLRPFFIAVKYGDGRQAVKCLTSSWLDTLAPPLRAGGSLDREGEHVK